MFEISETGTDMFGLDDFDGPISLGMNNTVGPEWFL